jgi:hypothetical protein
MGTITNPSDLHPIAARRGEVTARTPASRRANSSNRTLQRTSSSNAAKCTASFTAIGTAAVRSSGRLLSRRLRSGREEHLALWNLNIVSDHSHQSTAARRARADKTARSVFGTSRTGQRAQSDRGFLKPDRSATVRVMRRAVRRDFLERNAFRCAESEYLGDFALILESLS